MNFSGILIGVLTFFLIGLFHPIVIYAEYYFGSRCWPVFLLVGILCMILSVRIGVVPCKCSRKIPKNLLN